MAYVEMRIDSVRLAKYRDEWLIMLKEKDGQRYLPVYVDKSSADTVNKVMRGDRSDHIVDDGVRAMLAGGDEVALVIDGVNKGIFNAECIMGWRGGTSSVKYSIGQILAICMRTSGHILVEENVLDKAGIDIPVN